MNPLLLTVQNDFVGRLMADDLFEDIAIIAMRKAQTVSEINQQLKTVAGRSGKVGACVMVQMPVLDVEDPDLPGPAAVITQSLLVVEHPTINAGDKGTGKSAEEIAIAALQLFHHFVPFGVTQVFVGNTNAIVPVADLEGLPAYSVTVGTRVRLAILPKVVRPTIAADNGKVSPSTITMACATPSAVIWYTLDGSYPSSESDTALQYSAPFVVSQGATIRAAAELDGYQQSDIAQVTITGGTVPAMGGEGGEQLQGEGGENITAEG